MPCTRIRTRDSFLSCTCSSILSQAAINGLPIKVLVDDPVAQPLKLILILVQFVTMFKQKLRKLRRNFPERMLVSQGHERPGATAILKWGSSFPRHTEGGNALQDPGEESAPDESHVATNQSGHTRKSTALCSGNGSHRVAPDADCRRNRFHRASQPHTACPE